MKAKRRVVTGGNGFIGGQLVRALRERGDDVVVVDWDDRERFLQELEQSLDCDVVLHQGALTDTTIRDEALMLRENHRYSQRLLAACIARGVRLLYASSAAVYGTSRDFSETAPETPPLNAYALSKQLFDRDVRALGSDANCQVVGLRYFNVYGPGEQKKGKMASLVYQFHQQLRRGEPLRLFGASHGFDAGEQRRDFVCVEDVVAANLHFLDHPELSGIFNVGTGSSRSFNELAALVISATGRGHVEYVPFPRELEEHYQAYTRADLTRLRDAGFRRDFSPIEAGVTRYVDWLEDLHPSRRS